MSKAVVDPVIFMFSYFYVHNVGINAVLFALLNLFPQYILANSVFGRFKVNATLQF